MSLLWNICGAGRAVGKTTLALKLCEILPNCRYAKLGHGRVKPNKPDAFFTTLSELDTYLEASNSLYEHCVVESNALARLGRGDIIIFINGIEGKTNFRKDVDQLRTNAHLSICSDSKVSDWENRLAESIQPKSLRRAVCDCFFAQKQSSFCSVPVVRSKVWFESASAHVFGVGLARLLKNVDDSGTLQNAAKVSGMSYRYAWDLIRTAESHLGKTLIERHVGGADGGGSVLSLEGKQMLSTFEQINTKVAEYSDKCFARLWNSRGINAERK